MDGHPCNIDAEIEKIKICEEFDEKATEVFTKTLKEINFLREENERSQIKLEEIEKKINDLKTKIALKSEEVRFKATENDLLEKALEKLKNENEKMENDLVNAVEKLNGELKTEQRWNNKRDYIAKIRRQIEEIKATPPDPEEIQTLKDLLSGNLGKPSSTPKARVMPETEDMDMVLLMEDFEDQQRGQRSCVNAAPSISSPWIKKPAATPTKRPQQTTPKTALKALPHQQQHALRTATTSATHGFVQNTFQQTSKSTLTVNKAMERTSPSQPYRRNSSFSRAPAYRGPCHFNAPVTNIEQEATKDAQVCKPSRFTPKRPSNLLNSSFENN